MRPGGREAVVVANPGHLAWMAEDARALSEAGLLASYITPLASTDRGAAALSRFPLPAPLESRLSRELRRRRLPKEIPVSRLDRAGTVGELVAVASRRVNAPEPVKRWIADRRDRSFDRAVARRISGEHRAVISAYGAALRTLNRARSLHVSTFVEYPTHHHRYSASILQEELRLQPGFAHTMQFHRVPPRRLRLLESEIEEADRIIVLSSFSKGTFAECGVPDSKIHVINLGVDEDSFRPAPASDGDVHDDVFRVLFIGLITQRKGLSYLLEGFRRASIPRSELLLVGYPVGGTKAWAGTPGLRHLRWVPKWEVPQLFASAHVFVLPSLVEGFARVVLEAMASGLPVIVTPNTGAGDVVSDGDSGYVVPIRDPEAIANRLRHLYEHPEQREAMGRAARRKAEACTWRDYRSRLVTAVVEAT